MSVTSSKKFKGPLHAAAPDVVHAPYPYPSMEKSPREAVDHALEEVRAIVEDPTAVSPTRPG